MVEMSKEQLWRKFWVPRLRKLWWRVVLFIVVIFMVAIGNSGPVPALALLVGAASIAAGVFEALATPPDITIDFEHQIILFTAKDSVPTSSPAPPASPHPPDPA